MSGWFNDTQNPLMVGAEYQKIIVAWFIYQRTFVSFENIFVSEVFADYFISFYKKYGNIVGNTFWWCSYHSYGTKENTDYIIILYYIMYILHIHVWLYPRFPASMNLCCLQETPLNQWLDFLILNQESVYLL